MRELVGCPRELLVLSAEARRARYLRSRVALCTRRTEAAEGGCQRTWQFVRGAGEELCELLASANWSDLEVQTLELGSSTPCRLLPQSAQLFAAAVGPSQSIVSPLHYDQDPMVICQLCGRKRVLLFPPAAHGSLRPFATTHPLDRRAGLDTCSVAEADVSAARALGGVEVVVEEGEALLLPPYTWHEVSTLGGDTGTITSPSGLSLHPNLSFSIRLRIAKLEPPAPLVATPSEVPPPSHSAPCRACHPSRQCPEPCALWMSVGRNVEALLAEHVEARVEASGGAIAKPLTAQARLAAGRQAAHLLLTLARAIHAASGCRCGLPSPPLRPRWPRRPRRCAERGMDAHSREAAVAAAAALVEHTLPELLRFLSTPCALVGFLRRLPTCWDC